MLLAVVEAAAVYSAMVGDVDTAVPSMLVTLVQGVALVAAVTATVSAVVASAVVTTFVVL